MTTTAFLASLPAILGLTGFIVFWFLQHNSRGSEVTRNVLGKVRRKDPVVGQQFDRLKGKALSDALTGDRKIREIVGEHDFQLLQQALRHQFILSIIVYILCGILFLAGATMFLQQLSTPEKLSVKNITLESNKIEYKAQRVGLSDCVINWKSVGVRDAINVYIENVQAERRSKGWRTAVEQQRLVVPHNTYPTCLSELRAGGYNHVRIGCQAYEALFLSSKFDLLDIRIKIRRSFNEKKNAEHFAAMIDHTLVQNYIFEEKDMVCIKDPSPQVLTYRGIVHGKGDFEVENSSNIRWDTFSLIYFGIENAAIIRATTNPI